MSVPRNGAAHTPQNACPALGRPGDPPQLTIALRWFEKAELPVRRLSNNHLKISKLSYYVQSGSFNVDNQPRQPGHGLAALKAFLESKGFAPLPDVPLEQTLGELHSVEL
jgi:hypothetical protein